MKKLSSAHVYYVDDKWLVRFEDLLRDDGTPYPHPVSATLRFYEVAGWSTEADNYPVQGDLLFRLYRKWDGCNHFWFGEEGEGYIHSDNVKAMAESLIVASYMADTFIDQNSENGRDPDEGWVAPKGSYHIEEANEEGLEFSDYEYIPES